MIDVRTRRAGGRSCRVGPPSPTSSPAPDGAMECSPRREPGVGGVLSSKPRRGGRIIWRSAMQTPPRHHPPDHFGGRDPREAREHVLEIIDSRPAWMSGVEHGDDVKCLLRDQDRTTDARGPYRSGSPREDQVQSAEQPEPHDPVERDARERMLTEPREDVFDLPHSVDDRRRPAVQILSGEVHRPKSRRRGRALQP